MKTAAKAVARRKPRAKSSRAICVIRGCLVAAAVILAAILLYAIALKLGLLDEASIPLVNQVLKILGIALAAWVATRGQEKSLMIGAFTGACFMALCFLLFAALQGSILLNVSLLWDVGMGCIVGLVMAVLRRILCKRG